MSAVTSVGFMSARSETAAIHIKNIRGGGGSQQAYSGDR